jgi:hypothetical protein
MDRRRGTGQVRLHLAGPAAPVGPAAPARSAAPVGPIVPGGAAMPSSCGTLVPFPLLTNKRRIHLRSASVRTYTFFTTGFPRFLSIHGAMGLQAFDLPLLTNYSNPNND